MNEHWTRDARRELIEMRGESPAWGYQRGGTPSVEPTVLACLGLLASADGRPSTDHATIGSAAAWLSKIQQSDGSLPVALGVTTPGWSTPYALLLWCELAVFPGARKRACDWLLRDLGGPKSIPDRSDRILGHDPTIRGWPWVDSTHSWIEPTAMAILALCRQGQGDHPRVREGIRMIVDRCLDDGGWNCGNKSVFGRSLRALPGPTGMSLLALAARGDRSGAVSRSIDYLLRTLPKVRAPVSLGWGVLALRALHACPAQAESWLADSHRACADWPGSSMNPALLLLAAHAGESRFIAHPTLEEQST